VSDVDTSVMLDLVDVKIKAVSVGLHLLQEVRLQDSLALPATFSLTFAPRELGRGVDPLAVEGVDPSIGAEVEIYLGGQGDRYPEKVFDGEITALEPNFAPEGIRLVASGYDRSHRLHRQRKTRNFQKMTTTQIIQKIVGEAGLRAQVRQPTTEQHEYVQQNNETDFEFIHRLASKYDLEVVTDAKVLEVRPVPTGAPQPLELEYGENAANGAVRLHSFYPRATAAQQVQDVHVRGWDSKQKQAVVAKATVEQRGTKIGIRRNEVRTFGAGSVTIPDAPVTSMGEAKALAASVASYLGHGFVGAFGTCEGNPKVRAGTTLKIKGLGAEFSGTYRCSATTHVYGGGYSTSFEVLGRSPRDLLDLARPAARNTWGDHLVIGLVTNNRDPENLARVRVKYPTLDENSESAWARVVAVGAGPKGGGQLMLPQPDDEVLIGFENGNPDRPYVIGALWNGKDKPNKELWEPPGGKQARDGSYVLRSEKLIDMLAKGDINIKTPQGKMLVDVMDELTIVVGKAKIVLKKDGTITIEGGNVTVNGQMGTTVKGAKVDVQGSGPVTVKGATVAIN
jgi:phage protein D